MALRMENNIELDVVKKDSMRLPKFEIHKTNSVKKSCNCEPTVEGKSGK